MDFMKGLGMAIGGIAIGFVVIIFGIIGIFLFAILGALIGAITGWILSQTPILGDAVRAGFTAVFRIPSPDLVSIGAMLGFVAGFFKNWGNGGKSDAGHHETCKEHSKKNDWGEEIPEVHIDVKPKKRKKAKA